MESVDFITVLGGEFAETEDDRKDLIVSFAIRGEEPGEVQSLTLLRTPVYEALLPERERGVSVSHDGDPNPSADEFDILQRVELQGNRCRIVSRRGDYTLDLGFVDSAEFEAAKTLLQEMNFDESFELEWGEAGN